ncbi:MAG TPA: GNAT family protein [Acidimicrobiales bacterium]
MVQLVTPRQTPRLTLRRFELDDLDDLALIFASADVNRYLYSEPRDRDETAAVLTRRLELPDEVEVDNLMNVGVVLKSTERVIGDFMIRWSTNEHQQGEIGGSLHPDFHFQGYAREIYEVLLTIGFTEFGLHRIFARCDARNAASVRSLAKVGLHQEAHLVENEFVKGEWTDEIVMAIRKSEWEPRAL